MTQIEKITPTLRKTLWGGGRCAAALGLAEDCRAIGEIVYPMPPECPFLLKLIDAALPLSVQVHPAGEDGKDEGWWVLSHGPGASILLGFEHPASQTQIAQASRDGTLPSLCRKIPVENDRFYPIPAGTVHALGAGITVFEVSQKTEVTYRLYDYGRVDTDGNPRKLDIEKGAAVCRSAEVPKAKNIRDGDAVMQTPYFTAIPHFSPFTVKQDGRMRAVLFFEDGAIRENGDVPVREGECLYFSPDREEATVLCTRCIEVFA